MDLQNTGDKLRAALVVLQLLCICVELAGADSFVVGDALDSVFFRAVSKRVGEINDTP